MNSRHGIAILLVVLGLGGCDGSPADPTDNGTGSGALAGCQLTGDPASPTGATWGRTAQRPAALRPDVAPDIARALPSQTQASTIRAPYQIHHGDRDQVIPLLGDQLFAAFLSSRGVTNELIVYPGANHDDVTAAPEVLNRIRA